MPSPQPAHPGSARCHFWLLPHPFPILVPLVFNHLRTLLKLGGGGGYPIPRPSPHQRCHPERSEGSAFSALPILYLFQNQHLQKNTAFHPVLTEIVRAQLL